MCVPRGGGDHVLHLLPPVGSPVRCGFQSRSRSPLNEKAGVEQKKKSIRAKLNNNFNARRRDKGRAGGESRIRGKSFSRLNCYLAYSGSF